MVQKLTSTPDPLAPLYVFDLKSLYTMNGNGIHGKCVVYGVHDNFEAGYMDGPRHREGIIYTSKHIASL